MCSFSGFVGPCSPGGYARRCGHILHTGTLVILQCLTRWDACLVCYNPVVYFIFALLSVWISWILSLCAVLFLFSKCALAAVIHEHPPYCTPVDLAWQLYHLLSKSFLWVNFMIFNFCLALVSAYDHYDICCFQLSRLSIVTPKWVCSSTTCKPVSPIYLGIPMLWHTLTSYCLG